MTQRLYYDDSRTTRFTAKIREHLRYQGRPSVILDASYFYPTSGGQPADTGRINDVPVIDVLIRDADGAVIHVLADDVADDDESVTGQVDWARRFDHMQQHSGQHILSQAFVRAGAAQTVGFHLGDDHCTIDLDRDRLDAGLIAAAERAANEILWADLPVEISYLDLEQAAVRGLRKIPEIDGNLLRVVSIGDFDRTACGGTHVTRTGEVGMIKVVKTDRRRGQLRVTFLCGSRALVDYGHKNRLAQQLTSRLTVGQRDVDEAVARLQADYRALNRQLNHLQQTLLEARGVQLLAESRVRGPWRMISAVIDDVDPGQLRQLANRLTREAAVVALLATATASGSHLILARAADAPGAMQHLIKPALELLDSNAGGGAPAIAQGRSPVTDRRRLQEALATAERLLMEQAP